MDLENFPTSKSAIKMLDAVTEGFYNRSYVGKWIYQVMGMEMDDAVEKYEELQAQIFPETSTWGIIYHEQKYGIPINPALSLEERRAEVIRRRDIHSPMNPARIEEIVKGLTNVAVKVTENISSYTFAIDISTNGNTEQLNYSNVVRSVRKVKPSHLSFYAFFSASSAVNIIIETSAIEIWPLLAGEEFSGIRPTPNFTAGVSNIDVLSGADSQINGKVSELAGTLPDINAVTVLRKPEILTDILSDPIKKVATMPGEFVTGVTPDVSMECQSNGLSIISKAEEINIRFSTPISGLGTTGIRPESETVLKKEEMILSGYVDGVGKSIKHRLVGEDTEAASVNQQGIGAEVSGKAVQIIHMMCGEEL